MVESTDCTKEPMTLSATDALEAAAAAEAAEAARRCKPARVGHLGRVTVSLSFMAPYSMWLL